MATNLPITGKFNITATFKQVGKYWKTLGFHTGIDFTGDSAIYATCDGVVDTIAYSSAYGNYIIVKENNADRYHYFCHLSRILVKRGQKVTRVSVIGIMGSTGNTTGVHLHYEIRKQKGNLVESNLVNPAEYCGIPNEKGEYDSKDYQIVETIPSKYSEGQVVQIEIPVKIAYNNGEKSIIESGNEQFWVDNSVIKDNKIVAETIIAFAQGTSYIVQVVDEQFWIEEKYIIKEK
jgi:hypothetical protein